MESLSIYIYLEPTHLRIFSGRIFYYFLCMHLYKTFLSLCVCLSVNPHSDIWIKTHRYVCIYIYVSVSVSQVIASGSLGFVFLKLRYVHDCVLGCLGMGLFSKATKASTYAHVYMYIYMYMYMYICIYICMCICIYVYMYVCMYVCVCMYVYHCFSLSLSLWEKERS